MLSLLKQCSAISISKSLAPLSPVTMTQTRDFWRLVDQRYTSPHNTLQNSKFPQKSIDVEDPFDSRQEMAKDGYGVKLYDLKDGERKNLKAVVARFKRLDWGVWIRPRSGRAKKHWKKSMEQLNAAEKHVMCKLYHNRRFDRAVTHEIKAVRHIPDDPYKVKFSILHTQKFHFAMR